MTTTFLKAWSLGPRDGQTVTHRQRTQEYFSFFLRLCSEAPPADKAELSWKHPVIFHKYTLHIVNGTLMYWTVLKRHMCLPAFARALHRFTKLGPKFLLKTCILATCPDSGTGGANLVKRQTDTCKAGRERGGSGYFRAKPKKRNEERRENHWCQQPCLEFTAISRSSPSSIHTNSHKQTLWRLLYYILTVDDTGISVYSHAGSAAWWGFELSANVSAG